jgi:hypothetical protein
MGRAVPGAVTPMAQMEGPARQSIQTPFGYLPVYGIAFLIFDCKQTCILESPEPNTFQYEPSSGYYYNTSTGFYYDIKTGYYYNSNTNHV